MTFLFSGLYRCFQVSEPCSGFPSFPDLGVKKVVTHPRWQLHQRLQELCVLVLLPKLSSKIPTQDQPHGLVSALLRRGCQAPWGEKPAPETVTTATAPPGTSPAWRHSRLLALSRSPQRPLGLPACSTARTAECGEHSGLTAPTYNHVPIAPSSFLLTDRKSFPHFCPDLSSPPAPPGGSFDCLLPRAGSRLLPQHCRSPAPPPSSPSSLSSFPH